MMTLRFQTLGRELNPPLGCRPTSLFREETSPGEHLCCRAMISGVFWKGNDSFYRRRGSHVPVSGQLRGDGSTGLTGDGALSYLVPTTTSHACRNFNSCSRMYGRIPVV